MATKKPKNLKTYVLLSKEYNSHHQEGISTITFKAVSLDWLDQYISEWQSGHEELIPKGRFKNQFKGPKDFFYAGGFCSKDISFTCKETGEDLSGWYQKQGWGFFGD